MTGSVRGNDMPELLTIAHVLLVGINLVILGLTLKLYTEILKDKSIGEKMRKNNQ